jgi:uncharacterized protein (TIGR02996 family)
VDDAFLRQILAHPFDDGPRLVYADRLDERGDPRGEFIRVQCEIAREGDLICLRTGTRLDWYAGFAPRCRCRPCRLRRREYLCS